MDTTTYRDEQGTFTTSLVNGSTVNQKLNFLFTLANKGFSGPFDSAADRDTALPSPAKNVMALTKDTVTGNYDTQIYDGTKWVTIGSTTITVNKHAFDHNIIVGDALPAAFGLDETLAEWVPDLVADRDFMFDTFHEFLKGKAINKQPSTPLTGVTTSYVEKASTQSFWAVDDMVMETYIVDLTNKRIFPWKATAISPDASTYSLGPVVEITNPTTGKPERYTVTWTSKHMGDAVDTIKIHKEGADTTALPFSYEIYWFERDMATTPVEMVMDDASTVKFKVLKDE